jgi:hypothetical protein
MRCVGCLSLALLLAVHAQATLFPAVTKPYECAHPGSIVEIALRQPFITADPQPVAWTMHVHPQHEDVYVSASMYYNQGNSMFEMHIKQRIYQYLRGTVGGFSKPHDPLFLDVGANIGMSSAVCISTILLLS